MNTAHKDEIEDEERLEVVSETLKGRTTSIGNRSIRDCEGDVPGFSFYLEIMMSPYISR